MNILAIGNYYIVDELKKFNKVYSAGVGKEYDIQLGSYFNDIEHDILKKLPSKFTPDIILFFEGSHQVFPKNVSGISIPLGWHAMDSHINIEWHKEYSPIFDYIFVCQKDFIPELALNSNAKIMWAPLSVDQNIIKPLGIEKIYDISFVGTVHEKYYNRIEFLTSAQKHLPLRIFKNIFGQDMNRIFNQSRIILNHCIKNDLNFRVFEAMASGSMLMTPKTSNGLLDLFEDKTDLVCFDPNNISELIEYASYLLNNKNELTKIALNGYNKIIKNHTKTVRANQITSFMANNPVKHYTGKSKLKHLAKAYYMIGQLDYNFGSKKKYSEEADKTIESIFDNLMEQPQIDAETMYLRAMYHCSKGDRDKAKCLLDKALIINPKYIPALINLGIFAYNDKLNGLAAGYFKAAVLSDLDESKRELEKSFIIKGNESLGFINLGYIFSDLKLIDESIKYFKMALLLDKANPKIMSYIGFSYFAMKDYKKALFYLKESLRHDSSNKQIRDFIDSRF